MDGKRIGKQMVTAGESIIELTAYVVLYAVVLLMLIGAHVASFSGEVRPAFKVIVVLTDIFTLSFAMRWIGKWIDRRR